MTRSPVELVIFDCDGVLVDSERICVKVDAVIMADLPLPRSRRPVRYSTITPRRSA